LINDDDIQVLDGAKQENLSSLANGPTRRISLSSSSASRYFSLTWLVAMETRNMGQTLKLK